METPRSSTSCGRGAPAAVEDASLLDEASTARGMRLLAWQAGIALLVALLGSVAFSTGRFDAFPYSWF